MSILSIDSINSVSKSYSLRMTKYFRHLYICIIILFSFQNTNANSFKDSLHYKLSMDVQAGNGQYAPYYFTSNTHGVTSIKPNSGYLRAGLFKNANKVQKFDYALGIDLITSYNNNSPFWIQQLYGELKYRCLGLTVGSKEYSGVFKNKYLSSGGLIWSGNARPIPQIRVGIPVFVVIPFTNEWIQLKGDISYGLFTDKNWLEDHYNYQYSFITTGVWYHQKKIFFRSKEDKPFIVTIGAELAAQFGGTQKNYSNGELESVIEDKVKLKDLFTVLIPRGGDSSANGGDQAYYYGNHLGAWHAIFEYRFKNQSQLKGYFEWLFDDASGMGKLNGWDGLWGIEYNTNRRSVISSIVLEYLQTTNQGGPIHWAPGDFPGTDLTTEATGADNYYNNFFYNGWAHHGISNGSPLIKSPAYNKDGYLCFTDNRVKAIHIGLKGNISREVTYLAKTAFRKGWGTPFIPLKNTNKIFSGFLQIDYNPRKINHWLFSGFIGIDSENGSSMGDNIGVGLKIASIIYL